jgi:hypothetical protein
MHIVRRVLGIHGINQQRQSGDELAERWHGALQTGLASAGATAVVDRAAFTMVYFADLLEERRADWKGADESPIDPVAEPEVAEMIGEWQTAIDQAEASTPESKGDSFGIPPVPQQVQWAVQRLAAAPGLQHLGEGGVRRLARHMHAYLAHTEVRDAIQQRVDDQAGDDTVDLLIGHSMGSVVGYEWLHRKDPGRVGTFLSLGSPLGCPPVRRRLVPTPDAGGDLPPACRRWTNAAGRHDPIAWPKLLAAVFGASVTDVSVPTRINAHGVRTYLSSRAVGAVVAESLEA